MKHPDKTSRGTASAAAAETPRRLAGGLYVVATPIGNLLDVTLRAIDVLRAADLVLCEDTRITRRLFERHGIGARLVAYHDHNAERVRPEALAALESGKAVAIVSDAGTPLVSDPGYKLVTATIEAGHCVFPVPGPSAALAALIAAGLPTDRFFFEGFLPTKQAARASRLAEIADVPATIIVYENASRLAGTLRALSRAFGSRKAAVCRELTKLFEEVKRERLDALADHYEREGPPRGEIVIVIAPPPETAPASEAELDARLDAALRTLSLKDASAAVAAETGLPRKRVYERALARSGRKR
jgi:16S rRNA (cytidine1402-2'-O)-methyltransferase